MNDCTQYLIDKGYEPSFTGGVYFSCIFEEVVYLLLDGYPDDEINSEIPGIIKEYATEFFEVDLSSFVGDILMYQDDQREKRGDENKESLSNELLRLGKGYVALMHKNSVSNRSNILM